VRCGQTGPAFFVLSHGEIFLSMRRPQIKLLAACAIALMLANLAAVPARAASATLDGIKQSKTLRIAFRSDAPPFSYKDNLGAPAGYMVDLCKAVAGKLEQQLHTPLTVVYVPVTSVNRFEAIQQHKADILCEPTTATLDRRAIVDFSISTFVDGASLMIRSDDNTGAKDLASLSGKKVGVLAGTTTEQALRNTLKAGGIDATVVPVTAHSQGVAMLQASQISAYFADRSILVGLIQASSTPTKLLVADAYLTVEPYALALPHGDEDFRLAVDTALSHIYRSGEIGPIFSKTFGQNASQIIVTLFIIAGLPD
jgi:ABC-type amino acid transport substrate-binding protein